MTDQTVVDGQPVLGNEPVFTFGVLRESGVVWMINAAVFHPRGYTLALCYPEGTADDVWVEPIGWSILGDGSAPRQFQHDDTLDYALQAFQSLLDGTYDTVPALAPDTEQE